MELTTGVSGAIVHDHGRKVETACGKAAITAAGPPGVGTVVGDRPMRRTQPMSTTADQADARASRPGAAAPGRRWVRRWLPPQHGAWAMLLLPFGIGMLRAGPGWIHLPLFVAWLGGYLLSYYGQLALKVRTTSRVRPQLFGYGVVTAVAGGIALLMRPTLAWAGFAFAPLLAVNVIYAWEREERALANGLASVAQSSLMTFVAAAAVGAPLGSVTAIVLALMLYFVGSLLYVKTMIRARGEPAYLSASIAFHAAALVVAGMLGLALLVPFCWFLARAVVLPRQRPSVKQVGLLELAGSLLLASVLVVAG
jgi:hypothetical protein